MQSTIAEVVPDKKKLTRNDRTISEESKTLFEKRKREFIKSKPTVNERKKWNKRIKNACRQDYRDWVARWVDTIEKADDKGDNRAIFHTTKAVSGSNTPFDSK